jgi:hypothetical protein
MPDNSLQRRRKLYFTLSSEIAQIDNARLGSLLGGSKTRSSYGENHTIGVGRSKVFVKRVPVTDLEYENMFSTRNMYDLPTYYNYGLNSAGLGVFRELVTHIKTTNWVLEGASAAFPLLYHYRIIPFVGDRAELDPERHTEYVAYWGNDANVGRYILDRATANYELVLFLEYIPDTVDAWLLDNPASASFIIARALPVITFLRDNGILHLDSHFHNMLTDGKQVYLSDFGLALDRSFDLTPAERQFYRQNSYYDYGNLLWGLQSPLAHAYRNLPDSAKDGIAREYGLSPAAGSDALMPVLLNNVEALASSDTLRLDRQYLTCLVKYRPIIALMNDFHATMLRNPAKDTPFDGTRLRRLLKETGVIAAGSHR